MAYLISASYQQPGGIAMQLDNVADIYPLSPMQQGMLFHALSAPHSGVYVEQYSCKLQGNLKIPEFQQAWQQVIDRQPVLRTAFLWEGLDDPLQVVRQQVEVPWEIEDWRSHPPTQQVERLAEFLQRDRRLGFDLLQAPISRFRLIQLRDDTHQFIWSFHHLLADGWSIPIIWQDVLTCYRANCHRVSPALPPLHPYRDYIAWLQAQDLTAAEPFWRSQLQGFSDPTPLPAASTSHDIGSQLYRQQTKSLTPALDDALQALARSQRLTLNTLIQGAWALLLSHYSSHDQVTYGAVMSGRPAALKGVETMVGLFINTLPVRVSIQPEQLLIPWLQARQQQLLELRQYEATPLSDIQRWSDVPAGSPLFESIVVFENYPTNAPPDLGFEIRDRDYREQSNYPLALLVVPGDTLEFLLLYDPGRFEDAAIARLLDHLESLLIAFVEHPQATLADLPRLSPADQQQLVTWQQTNYPQDDVPDDEAHGCIHHLIEAQVKRTPGAPAVTFADQTLTYSELNQQADQLADALRSQGVTCGDRVALCLNPSLDRIISILAVLKTGAAYVPLDPTYPAARLDYCLRDTTPQVVLTHHSVALPDTGIPRLYLDDADEKGTRLIASLQIPSPASPTPPLPHSPSPHPDNLAYIIYTSGSTGQPKGVMVTHRNLVHSTTARSQVYPEPVGRFLLLSSIAFDSSVAGIFWTLCQGGTIVLPPDRIEQDLQQLATLIAQQQITHTLCVPTLYSLLLDAAEPRHLAKLHTVIVAGEACPRSLAQQHYAKLPATDLYNEYGPTEATVWCTAHRVHPELTPGPIPIGTPIPNTQIHLLDPTLKPVPIGAIGELYVGGKGVSQGYLNQPERNAAAFIKVEGRRQKAESKIQNPKPKIQNSPLPIPPSPHPPLSPSPPPSPLYKTGDLARYRADGTLEWLGRCDRQVKIRGYRIELGEIEDALRQDGAVREAVVVAQSMAPPPDSVDSLMAALTALAPERVEALLAAVGEGR
ncbi:MAG: amino acid adenylation domain-containing protein [Cyanobacteria bacterium P01_A01_bin.123]